MTASLTKVLRQESADNPLRMCVPGDQACAAQAAGLGGSTHIRPAESRQRLQVAAIQEQLHALEHRLSQQQQEQLGVSICRDVLSISETVRLLESK